jgi:S-formylglutathione hydrolase FrmB
MTHGQVLLERFESRLLAGNPAGDPHVRTVAVYLPPSYATQPERRFPVVHLLAGFSARGRGLLNDSPWSPALDERMDRLISRGAAEAILVMPDCCTRFGGSQYLDSAATGPYDGYVTRELVGWADERFRTLPGRDHRGVAGKSSGGYGALVLAMRHPDVFGAAASLSGDMCFDYCYRGDIPGFCTRVQLAGGIEAWLGGFESRRHKSAEDFATLNILGMAAAYSPAPGQPLGVALPCDLATGSFRPEVWDRWLQHDPITLVERAANALRSLRMLHVECGTRDEYHLIHGARMFHRRLDALGVPHTYEEFDDGHRDLSYRYEVSLPRMAAVLER